MYKIVNKCCVEDCPVEECKEPVCAEEFPGGVKAFLQHRKMMNLLKSGFDMEDVKAAMGLNKDKALRIFQKTSKVT